MSRRTKATVVFLGWVLAFAGMTVAAGVTFAAGVTYPGVGRTATADEIAAWDIDVRPDFKGLPKGSGSVANGQRIWDAKCASCHGTFGESNEVFTPLVGGTTAADIESGRVKSLVTGNVARTTLMKVSTLSTLWDYVRRAMPWNTPKSLTTDEVYAVVAYMLNLGDILPDDFVLSDANIAEVQERLPNRNGTTRNHGLWDVKGKPDVTNIACMKDCETKVHLASAFPNEARGSHGDLSQQNRLIGATASSAIDEPSLAKSRGCLACHGVDKKIVGPAFKEIAARYKADPSAGAKLAGKIRGGSAGTWGSIPMPANPALSQGEAAALAQWVLGL